MFCLLTLISRKSETRPRFHNEKLRFFRLARWMLAQSEAWLDRPHVGLSHGVGSRPRQVRTPPSHLHIALLWRTSRLSRSQSFRPPSLSCHRGRGTMMVVTVSSKVKRIASAGRRAEPSATRLARCVRPRWGDRVYDSLHCSRPRP
jgi:hypothetical protein